MCFRCNVDYSGSQSTWGCHESYFTASPKKSCSRRSFLTLYRV